MAMAISNFDMFAEKFRHALILSEGLMQDSYPVGALIQPLLVLCAVGLRALLLYHRCGVHQVLLGKFVHEASRNPCQRSKISKYVELLISCISYYVPGSEILHDKAQTLCQEKKRQVNVQVYYTIKVEGSPPPPLPLHHLHRRPSMRRTSHSTSQRCLTPYLRGKVSNSNFDGF